MYEINPNQLNHISGGFGHMLPEGKISTSESIILGIGIIAFNMFIDSLF